MMRGYEILGIYSHLFKLRRSRRSPPEVIEAVQGAKEVQGWVEGESPQVDRGISGIKMALRQRTFVQIEGSGPQTTIQNRGLGVIPNTLNTSIAAPLVPRCSPSGHLGRVVGCWWLIWVKPAKTLKRVMSLNSSSRVLRIKDVFLSVCRRRTSAERVLSKRKVARYFGNFELDWHLFDGHQRIQGLF